MLGNFSESNESYLHQDDSFVEISLFDYVNRNTNISKYFKYETS